MALATRSRLAALDMGGTVKDGAAFGTEQMGPARRFATLFHPAPCAHAAIGVAGLFGCSRLHLVGPAAREKIDREADRPERLYFVADLGRDRLERTGAQHAVERGLGLGNETQLPVPHIDPSPGPSCDAMSTEQACRHRVLVPLLTRSHQRETIGQFGSVT